ncbi:hypothetical protein B0H11DRAFT_2208244 [Mycena galericulata]|nr:hypothetical protein B0H11DRAFT_2208244 [Mycena galericulata]
MSDSLMNWIWSTYTISPDPQSGMSTLRDTCVALLNYPLTSSSFIPAIAGLALHPSVAEPFREVFPILKHLMYSAAQHHGASQPLFDREHADFRLVTIIGVRRHDAEAAWGRLLQKVADAMEYIEGLCALEEMSVSVHSRAAQVLHISSRGPPRGPLSRSVAASIDSATESIVHASRAALATTLPVASPPSSSRCSLADGTCPVGQSTLRREFPSRQAGRTVEEFHDKGASRRVEKSAGYACTGTLRTSQSTDEELAEERENVAIDAAETSARVIFEQLLPFAEISVVSLGSPVDHTPVRRDVHHDLPTNGRNSGLHKVSTQKREVRENSTRLELRVTTLECGLQIFIVGCTSYDPGEYSGVIMVLWGLG